jgi:hypothetical protein
MPLAKPLYLTADFSDLTPDEIMRAKRSVVFHEYNQSEKGRRNSRSNSLMHNFGISVEDYEALLKAQDGKCATRKSAQNGDREANTCA